jgi:MORN repeat
MRQATIITTAAILLVAFSAGAQTNNPLPPDWITAANQPCKVWNPQPQPDDSVTWSGACVDGLASGKGILRWMKKAQPDVEFNGEYKDGKRNGHGVLTTANGYSVEGVWVDDNLLLSVDGGSI